MLFMPLFFATGFLLAQTSGNDCIPWLKKVYRSMEQAYRPTGDKMLYLNYDVTTVLSEGSYQTAAELYSNRKKSWFISKEVEVYQDQSVTVSILPSRKIIFISDFTGKERKEMALQQFSLLQDTVFQLCNVSFCGKPEEAGKSDKQITLQLSEPGKKKLNVEEMDFYADEKKEQLNEVHIKYSSGHPIQAMIIKFNKMESSTYLEKLDGTLLTEIMDKNGNIKEKYKNYSITDNRSKKTSLKTN